MSADISPTQTGEFEATESERSKTPDGADELKALLAEQSKRLQEQSAILGKITNRLGKLEKTDPVDPEPKARAEEPKKTDKFDPMAERFSKLETRLKAQEDAAKLLAMRDALVENGVDPGSAKQFAKWISLEHGEGITAELDDSGGFAVAMGETSLGDWTKAYLESESGKALIPTRVKKDPIEKAHTGAKRSAGATGKTMLDPVAFSKMAAERVLAARKEKKPADSFMSGFSLNNGG